MERSVGEKRRACHTLRCLPLTWMAWSTSFKRTVWNNIGEEIPYKLRGCWPLSHAFLCNELSSHSAGQKFNRKSLADPVWVKGERWYWDAHMRADELLWVSRGSETWLLWADISVIAWYQGAEEKRHTAALSGQWNSWMNKGKRSFWGKYALEGSSRPHSSSFSFPSLDFSFPFSQILLPSWRATQGPQKVDEAVMRSRQRGRAGKWMGGQASPCTWGEEERILVKPSTSCVSSPRDCRWKCRRRQMRRCWRTYTRSQSASAPSTSPAHSSSSMASPSTSTGSTSTRMQM